jgi:hypothetical protein
MRFRNIEWFIKIRHGKCAENFEIGAKKEEKRAYEFSPKCCSFPTYSFFLFRTFGCPMNERLAKIFLKFCAQAGERVCAQAGELAGRRASPSQRTNGLGPIR